MQTPPRGIQAELFEWPSSGPASGLPEGMTYIPAFLSPAEEAEWLTHLALLPVRPARYKEYTARREVASYVGTRLEADPPVQEMTAALRALRERVAAWMGVAAKALVHTLVARYAAGTALGWHRDAPQFKDVVGISLGHEAVMRLRPYPPREPRRASALRLDLAPRSLYRLSGPARWAWQHSVAPVPSLRWSITFRTATQRAPHG